MEKLKSILTNYDFKNFISNIGWLGSEKAIRFCIGILVNAMMARHFGPQIFGELSYYIAFFSLFSPLFLLGLDSIIIKQLVRSQDKKIKETLLNTAFTLKLFSSILVFIISSILLAVVTPGIQIASILIGLYIVFQSFEFIEFYYQSISNSKQLVKAKTLSFLIINITRLGMLHLKLDYIYFCYSIILEYALNSIALLYEYKKLKLFKIQFNLDVSDLKQTIVLCFPIIISDIALTLYLKVDQVMLKILNSSTELGYYTTALKLSEIWYHIPLILSGVLAQRLYTKFEDSQKNYYLELSRYLKLLMFIAFSIGIFFQFFSEIICVKLFGQQFTQSYKILQLHIWACIFIYIANGSQTYFINKSLFKIRMFQTWIGALINIGLNLILIPKYGGIGAAISTLIAYAMSAIFLNVFWSETRDLFKIQLHSLILKTPKYP